MTPIDPIEENEEQLSDPEESMEAPELDDNEENLAEHRRDRENFAVPAIPEKH